ncbi:GFA family protein [Gammaproteobacteria bacterium]|jgi:hypothetical protein|nr:GFA family protein [Gammaproteobacteria bacterium]MDB4210078.1 GFA family protein [Gammaproteobacteria bacterium]MDB9700679.1 GFA family protein [Gammaproteobacteria bacterium]MDC1300234.1 GFA family protein [Gammaproteobacteria bacterium]MDC1326247.1 GFA family protein [Gammaproteobacteria bacterium]
MNMNSVLQSGGCLCGKIAYEFEQSKVLATHHCHCKDCQKSTGSGKATILVIPNEELKLQGDLKFYTVTGSAGSHITRGFCENCGSPVMSFVEENSSIKFIKAGTLEDSSWLTITSNFWSATAQSWSPVDEEVFTFSHNPS